MKPGPEKPIKLGADKNKMMILGGLLVVLVIVFFMNRSDSEIPAPAAHPQTAAQTPAAAAGLPQAPTEVLPIRNANISRQPRTIGNRANVQDFKPSLKPKRPEERVDPMTIDPTLRIDLLAKLANLKGEGGARSLFEFGKEPPKELDPKIPVGPLSSRPGFIGPKPPPPPPPPVVEPPKPPPPPIPLKYYGYITPVRQGVKRGFFLRGEDIFVASEGELIDKKYKVVRIGINSVVMEDVEHEHNQQTLQLTPEQAG